MGSSVPLLVSATPRIDLNLLMLFLEIVNAGSISQAAARLDAPKPRSAGSSASSSSRSAPCC